MSVSAHDCVPAEAHHFFAETRLVGAHRLQQCQVNASAVGRHWRRGRNGSNFQAKEEREHPQMRCCLNSEGCSIVANLHSNAKQRRNRAG